MFPDRDCTAAEAACRAAPGEKNPEIDADDFTGLVAFVAGLAPPQARVADAVAASGAVLFNAIGCAACHRPTLTTGKVPGVPDASHREIHPYTDLLLHDMGPDLADGRPDHDAGGRDWRTTPLWGIGLAGTVSETPRYLHDGRARSLTEAILWHGGEATAARTTFATLAGPQRAALLSFLNTL
jgi:CxxC motif-containing protein (DUF1111 family)